MVGVWVGTVTLAAMVAAFGPAAFRLLWLVNMQAVHRWEKFRFFFLHVRLHVNVGRCCPD